MSKEFTLRLANWLGYINEEEVDLLQGIAMRLPNNGFSLNIGAGGGTTALAVAECRPDVSITSVDMSPGGPLGGLEGERNAFDGAGIEHPTQILGDSKEVGKQWNGSGFDMILIDGDHSEDGIRGDIESWMPHLKPGGYVVFHDYTQPMWPAVKKVVDELIVPTYKLIGQARWLVAFQSPIPKEVKKDAPNKTGGIAKPRAKSRLQSRK